MRFFVLHYWAFGSPQLFKNFSTFGPSRPTNTSGGRMRRTISFTVLVFSLFPWAVSAQVCVDLPNGRSRLDGVWSPNTCEYNLSVREAQVGTTRGVDYCVGAGSSS